MNFEEGNVKKFVKNLTDKARQRDPEIIDRMLEMTRGFCWQQGKPELVPGNETSSGDASAYLSNYNIAKK